jgi:hypothetical protein
MHFWLRLEHTGNILGSEPAAKDTMHERRKSAVLRKIVGSTWRGPTKWFLPRYESRGEHFTRKGRAKAVRPFLSLVAFLAHVPAVEPPITWSYFDDGDPGWWTKFQIRPDHPLAWRAVQEFAYVLNDLSMIERLPTRFFPKSPPPYLNGGPEDFLTWIIECEHPEFSPDDTAKYLEGYFPRPVYNLKRWRLGSEHATPLPASPPVGTEAAKTSARPRSMSA